MVNIIEDTLIKSVFSYDVVLYPMGINNAMNKGTVYDIALNFPEVREDENQSGYGDKRKMGTIRNFPFKGIIFCACYIGQQKRENASNQAYLDVEAIKSCLSTINSVFQGKKIATPLFYGLPKEEMVRLFEEELKDCNVDIYTEEKDTRLEAFKKIAALHRLSKEKKITSESYIRLRSEVEWIRRNGIYKEMPEDYTYRPRAEKLNIEFNGDIKSNTNRGATNAHF